MPPPTPPAPSVLVLRAWLREQLDDRAALLITADGAVPVALTPLGGRCKHCGLPSAPHGPCEAYAVDRATSHQYAVGAPQGAMVSTREEPAP